MSKLNIVDDLVEQIANADYRNFSLMSGSLGRVLLLTSYRNNYDDVVKSDLKKAVLFLDKFNYFNDTSFCNGMAGLAWLLRSNQRNFYEIEMSKTFWRKIDNCIVKSIYDDIQNHNYDYLHGAIGKLHYLKLVGGDIYYNSNNAFIKHLDNSKIVERKGVSWRKPLINHTKSQYSKAIKYDIGLAHGVPSILNYLAEVYLIDKEQSLAYSLICNSVDFLLSLKSRHSTSSIYPSFIFEDNEFNESRLAWCYGDLGVAYAICKAAVVCQRNDWLEEAIHITLETCKRKSHKSTLVFDSSLCHGAAGLGLLYFKMFELTGNQHFRNVSIYWNSVVGEMLITSENQCEYKYYDSINGFESKMGLLDGLIGTVFSILNMRQQCDKNWIHSLSL